MATADDGLVLDDVDPASTRRIHLVGVAGTGMGAFAGMLKAAGHEVTGSDQNVYPPMSDMLRAWAIPVFTPYDPANLDLVKPDLVVIGNVIRRVNPEATEVRARRLPQMSFPAALGTFFLRKRHSVVVAGHARQDHDDGAPGTRARRRRPGSVVPGRGRHAELRRELPAR